MLKEFFPRSESSKVGESKDKPEQQTTTQKSKNDLVPETEIPVTTDVTPRRTYAAVVANNVPAVPVAVPAAPASLIPVPAIPVAAPAAPAPLIPIPAILPHAVIAPIPTPVVTQTVTVTPLVTPPILPLSTSSPGSSSAGSILPIVLPNTPTVSQPQTAVTTTSNQDSTTSTIPPPHQMAVRRSTRQRKPLDYLDPSPVERTVDLNQRYTIERILDDRFFDGEHKYLVKWEGFNRSHDSWEPEANLPAAELSLYHDGYPGQME
jgi:hypothetical protein